MSQGDPAALEGGRCQKCGFINGPGIKFCGNCGAKLGLRPRPDYVQALASMHIATSAYVILTLAFNYLAHSIGLLVITYSVAGVAGLYIGYSLHMGHSGKWLKFASAITIALGLLGTSVLFWLGLTLQGLIGPAWVLYLATAYLLWLCRKSV